MKDTPPYTLAILAGGEGSRMGRPKGELVIDGRPILAFLLDQLQWSGPTLLVTAPGREHPPGHERFNREVTDPVAGLGPLRGILTALEHVTTPIVIVATVDMPEVVPTQLAWLRERAVELWDGEGVLITRGAMIEPFPSIFRQSAAPLIAARIDAKQLSVQRLVDDPSFIAVEAPHEWGEDVWTNLNRPEDVEAFTRRFTPRLTPRSSRADR
jgi:molybdopterin-guanine dinucleotide biosynthesis protein A